MEPIVVLHQEKHFAVAVKPAGVLSQSAPQGTGSVPDMVSLLAEQLASDIFPVHRLDRETEGVMLYAKTPAGAAKLSGLAARGVLEKRYLAAVHGVPEPDKGEMRDLLWHDAKKNKSYVVTRQRGGVRQALLDYERLAVSEYEGLPVSLVRVLLHTGRTHQIRVQFASRAMPVLGDSRYGSRARCGLCLFAEQLAFVNPFTCRRMSFTAQPKNEIFAIFGNCIL